MKKWEKTFINPSTSIKDAIRILESSGMQISLVVDQNKSIYCTNHDAHYHLLIEDENKIIDIPQENIDLNIPRDKLVVITGISGSGKSSLAFDTIYAEGQRRYVESLSAYARQFLEMMQKPDVDSIEGLSPAISIEQKTTSKNPRSTVGTITEIYDYMLSLIHI